MPTRRVPRRLGLLALAVSVATASGALAAPACDSTTSLTLLGADTKNERALFALPPNPGSTGWLLEADLAAGAVTAWPEVDAAVRLGGSVGPGPVLTARRCGEQCLQMQRFRAGRWERLGESFLASRAETVQATWDRAGAPWVALQELAGKVGVGALAYRFEHGDWVSKGSLLVRALGNPGLAPAPPGEAGVVAGDGQFTAEGKPRRWATALPDVPEAEHGELLWLGGRAAAFLGPEGSLRLTEDGKRWEPVRWQPWSAGEGDLAWKAGKDYWLELPDGERASPLAVIWNDRRVAPKTRLYIGQRQSDGQWRVLLQVAPGILTDAGDRLPFNHLLRFDGERWALVTGCVARGEGSALAVRRFRDGVFEDPKLLPISVGNP